MGRSAEMPCGLEARLLLLLWFANLSLAIPSGVSPDEVGVLAPEAGLGDTGVPNNLVSPVGDGVELAQLAVGTKGDGCSGAYKKFKANITKMTTLKTKAEKKATAAKKGKKKADSLYKRCKKDHKEIISKATWKKAVIKKNIKIGSDKRFGKLKKKLTKKMTARKKKMKKTIAKAKKTATKEKTGHTRCKKNLKKTKRNLKARYKQKK